MPTVIFKDGKQKQVSYTQGAQINVILKGDKEPEDERQAEFVQTVETVKFEPIPVAQPFGMHRHQLTPEQKAQRQAEADEILNNDELTGFQKMKAMADLFKKRKKARV